MCVRARPQNSLETKANDREVWEFIGANKICLAEDIRYELLKKKKGYFSRPIEYCFG